MINKDAEKELRVNIYQAMARGYCTRDNEAKELDSILIYAMADEVLLIPQIQSILSRHSETEVEEIDIDTVLNNVGISFQNEMINEGRSFSGLFLIIQRAKNNFLQDYNTQLQSLHTEKGEWIDVNNELPNGFWDDSGQEVFKKYSEQVNILVESGKVGTGAYNRETKKWFIGYLIPEYYQELRTTVTHWMPLPKPIKRKEV